MGGGDGLNNEPKNLLFVLSFVRGGSNRYALHLNLFAIWAL